MFGFGHIGQFAIGFIQANSSTPTRIYKPVSRLMAGGFSVGRPAVVAVLGVDLLWDNDDFIVWDNDDNIGWEG